MFRAAARDKDLVFDMAGLVGGNEVFRDRQTGSQWRQSTLEAISVPLKGAHFPIYPFLLTTSGEWHKLHPNTLVLKPLPGYEERLASMNKIIRQGVIGMAGRAHEGAYGHDMRLRPRDTIVGLETGGVVKAYPMFALQRERVVKDTVGGLPRHHFVINDVVQRCGLLTAAVHHPNLGLTRPHNCHSCSKLYRIREISPILASNLPYLKAWVA